LYDYIEKNKEIGSLWVKNNSSWDHWNILPFNNLFRKTWISVCFPTNVISQVNRVQWSFFILHKPLFEILWWFDEKYFLYKEEEDLQYRIEKLGYKTIYNPTIMVFHVWWVVAKKRKHIWRSISYFIWKWLFKNPNNP
jgi:GT2 family glycosyltransferase